MHIPGVRTVLFATMVIFACAAGASADREVLNRTYVQSGPDGVFYARCTPSAGEGTAGRIDVYSVGPKEDKPVDRYDWYAPNGVTLGWSPIGGKVAMLAVIAERRGAGADWRGQEELRFAIAGKVLRSYTSGELIDLGAAEVVSCHGGPQAAYRVLGCEQVHGTNEYDFVLEVAGGSKGEGTKLRFDITTGALRPDRPRVPIGAADDAEAIRVARAFMARTHARLEIGLRPPVATYNAGTAGATPMWVVRFDVAAPKDPAGRAGGAASYYPFDVNLRPDGQVESTTSPQ